MLVNMLQTAPASKTCFVTLEPSTSNTLLVTTNAPAYQQIACRAVLYDAVVPTRCRCVVRRLVNPGFTSIEQAFARPHDTTLRQLLPMLSICLICLKMRSIFCKRGRRCSNAAYQWNIVALMCHGTQFQVVTTVHSFMRQNAGYMADNGMGGFLTSFALR